MGFEHDANPKFHSGAGFGDFHALSPTNALGNASTSNVARTSLGLLAATPTI